MSLLAVADIVILFYYVAVTRARGLLVDPPELPFWLANPSLKAGNPFLKINFQIRHVSESPIRGSPPCVTLYCP